MQKLVAKNEYISGTLWSKVRNIKLVYSIWCISIIFLFIDSVWFWFQIVLCQIFEDGFKSRYCDDQPLTDISESEPVYAIETLPPPSQDSSSEEFESSYTQLIVVNTERRSSPTR